jgi:membrane fusion protein, copper/silver efflux system
MKRPLSIVLVTMGLIAAFILGSWYSARNNSSESSSQQRKVLYYVDPMHPNYKSDKPGIAPDCGMQLEPVYADGNLNEENVPRVPGAVKISPEKQQLLGVRMGYAERIEGVHNMRITGRVAPDETRIYTVNAALDGWIVEARPNTVGSLVRKNEILASFYSPEFLGSEQAFIYALNAMDRFQTSGNETSSQIKLTSANIQQYKDTLKNQGMSDFQIENLARERLLTQKIYVVAPAAGFVLVRNVSHGLRFERGKELYRIADLSHVWILADIFENEEGYFRPGANAKVTHVAQGRALEARVSNVLPIFDPSTRTLKVRLEVDNPGYRLRPDMFVDVEFPKPVKHSLTVPSDAVINTGRKQIVFVDRGHGYFEPRRVETGWRMDGRMEIRNGLTEGDRIIISGNFLVDSESQMQLAAAGLPSDYEIDPVCNMGVNPHKASTKSVEYNGHTYYFCSDDCKSRFIANPGKYSGHSSMVARRESEDPRSPEKEMHDSSQISSSMVKDLVCNMEVDPSIPGIRHSEYRGKTYYFCSEQCRKSFEENPQRFFNGGDKTIATNVAVKTR